MPRGIADERDFADRTVTPTGSKTKMNGFVEISTLLIHSAPKQKSNEWMHLSPFYTRMHGEWLRYAKSTSQFYWRFLFSQRFQVNPYKIVNCKTYILTTRIAALCTYPEQPVCTSLLFTLLFIKSQYTVFVSFRFLHIYCFAHLIFLHIQNLFLPYICSCVVLLLYHFLLFCTVH